MKIRRRDTVLIIGVFEIIKIIIQIIQTVNLNLNLAADIESYCFYSLEAQNEPGV